MASARTQGSLNHGTNPSTPALRWSDQRTGPGKPWLVWSGWMRIAAAGTDRHRVSRDGNARQAEQRRPRPLSGRRDHQGRPLPVLRPRRRLDRPAPPRPAVHDEALARGAVGRVVLPEAGAEGHSRVAADTAVPHLSARGRHAARRLPARQRPRGAAVDGADALHRHERVVLARRQAGAARLRPLRPRPAGRTERLRAGDRGRAPDPRAAGRARAARLREDERRRRHPRRRADHAALDVPADVRLRRAGFAAAGAAPRRAGDDGVAEEEAPRRPRRPPAERPREDDRVGVLRAGRSRARPSRRRSAGRS